MRRGVDTRREAADDHDAARTQPGGELAGARASLDRGFSGTDNGHTGAVAQNRRIARHEKRRRRMLLLHIIEWAKEVFESPRLAWDRRE
jgi:hypothetical protein